MRRRLLAALAVSTCLAPGARAATPTQLIVFGDSLSDTGNNGRYTNSYLWDEHVAGAYKIPCIPSSKGGTDYAVSSTLITSGANSLPDQVQTYLAAHPTADPHAVYVIWGGGNDAFSTLTNPASGPQVEAEGIQDTLAMINSLYQAGARYFIIGNVPRTDLTPEARMFGHQAVAQQRDLVLDWNGKLAAALTTLNLPGATLRSYDSAHALSAIFTSPTHFDFKNDVVPCSALHGSVCPRGTLWYIPTDPAATAHILIASAIMALIDQ